MPNLHAIHHFQVHQDKVELRLALKSKGLDLLLSGLQELQIEKGSMREKCFRLEAEKERDSSWALFIKKGGDPSKLIVARPKPLEWVGTLSLSELHLERFIEQLQRWGGADSQGLFCLNDLAPTHRVSNMKIILEPLDV